MDPNRPPTVNINPRILVPMLGILVAPFVGFLLNANFGLGILVICLATMGWMTWGVAKMAPEPQARTLRMGAILNMIMAVAAFALLIVRI